MHGLRSLGDRVALVGRRSRTVDVSVWRTRHAFDGRARKRAARDHQGMTEADHKGTEDAKGDDGG